MKGITVARDENLSAIDNAFIATLKTLSAQEYAQTQAVDDAGYLKQVSIEQLAHTGAAALGRGVLTAMDTLEQALRSIHQQFAKADPPDPAALGPRAGPDGGRARQGPGRLPGHDGPGARPDRRPGDGAGQGQP